MKPLNLDNRPCSPISSNCVVWQGPTLDCIGLCNGDTISDVVAKMATELCTLLDQTNVTNYDLTCLGITACVPKDFQSLIQLLIDRICELNNVESPGQLLSASACPDCVVSVAPCFVENGQTTMQLIDYVQMIANKICSLIEAIDNLQTQINNLDIRVTVLENTPPPTFTLPSIDTGCLQSYISGIPESATIDIVLNTLLNDPIIGYCALVGSTGLPADLVSAVAGACITSSTITLTDPPNPFGTVYASWVDSPATVADTITNLWIALCDIYNFVSTLTPGPSLTIEEPCPCNEGIANDADIYVHIDISSGPYSEDTCPGSFLANKEVLCTAVYNWYTNYQTANPSYTGNLYIFEISLPETYLKFPRIIKNGNLSAITTPVGFNWLNPLTATTVGAVVPPNWNTLSWAPPTSILFISFVNEANNGSVAAQTYHGQNNPPSLTLNQLQPTSGWTTDHAEFVFDYNNHWDFFRGVIYPANSFDNTSRNFLLHAYAATTNGPITSSGLSTALGSNFDATFSGMTYPISNVYVTANKGLWNYNWTPVLNKTTTGGGCIIEFTEEEFATDLDNILGSGPCDCASLINSWNPTTQTLALNSLTSCSLDISVSENGCISIELPPEPLMLRTQEITQVCPLYVEIIRSDNNNYFEASVTGGIEPYTYNWSFASSIKNDVGELISQAPNNSMLLLEPIVDFPERISYTINDALWTLSINNSIDTSVGGLLKLVVTDANGCKAKDVHFIWDKIIP